MTYDKIFRLCRNHKDLYYKFLELKGMGHNVESKEFVMAYKKRFEELKNVQRTA